MGHTRKLIWHIIYRKILPLLIGIILMISICNAGIFYSRAEPSVKDSESLYYALYSVNLLTSQTTSLSTLFTTLCDAKVPDIVYWDSQENERIVFGENITLSLVHHSDRLLSEFLLTINCHSCGTSHVVLSVNPQYTFKSLLNGDISYDKFYFDNCIDSLPEISFNSISQYAESQSCLSTESLGAVEKAIAILATIPLGSEYTAVLETINSTYATHTSIQHNGSVLKYTIYQNSSCYISIQMKFNNDNRLVAVMLNMTPPIENSMLSLPLGSDPTINMSVEVGMLLYAYQY